MQSRSRRSTTPDHIPLPFRTMLPGRDRQRERQQACAADRRVFRSVLAPGIGESVTDTGDISFACATHAGCPAIDRAERPNAPDGPSRRCAPTPRQSRSAPCRRKGRLGRRANCQPSRETESNHRHADSQTSLGMTRQNPRTANQSLSLSKLTPWMIVSRAESSWSGMETRRGAVRHPDDLMYRGRYLESNRRRASLIARGACGVGQAVDPRIEHGHARFHILGGVTRDDREAMMLTSRSDDQIGLREGVPALAPLLD